MRARTAVKDDVMSHALDAAKKVREREARDEIVLDEGFVFAGSAKLGKLSCCVSKMLSEKIGPYAPGEESRFKKDLIKYWESINDGWHYFCVESPDTMRGFPDVLAISDRGRYQLYELKVSDNKGFIKFERTQPLFYKKHGGLHALVVAWNVPFREAVYFSAGMAAQAGKLRIQLPREDMG
jgi:hypothetical protein